MSKFLYLRAVGASMEIEVTAVYVDPNGIHEPQQKPIIGTTEEDVLQRARLACPVNRRVGRLEQNKEVVWEEQSGWLVKST